MESNEDGQKWGDKECERSLWRAAPHLEFSQAWQCTLHLSRTPVYFSGEHANQNLGEQYRRERTPTRLRLHGNKYIKLKPLGMRLRVAVNILQHKSLVVLLPESPSSWKQFHLCLTKKISVLITWSICDTTRLLALLEESPAAPPSDLWSYIAGEQTAKSETSIIPVNTFCHVEHLIIR